MARHGRLPAQRQPRSRLVMNPMAGYEVIVPVTSLVPMLGHPMEVTALPHPVTVDPHVTAAIPTPVARRPHESGARRGRNDDPRGGGRDRDVDADAGGGRGGGAQQESRRSYGRQSSGHESLE